MLNSSVILVDLLWNNILKLRFTFILRFLSLESSRTFTVSIYVLELIELVRRTSLQGIPKQMKCLTKTIFYICTSIMQGICLHCYSRTCSLKKHTWFPVSLNLFSSVVLNMYSVSEDVVNTRLCAQRRYYQTLKQTIFRIQWYTSG